MAEYADVRPRSVQPSFRLGGHLAFFIQHMTQRNLHSVTLKEAPAGKAARFVMIHVARDRRDRCNATQASNHRVLADVAGMEDFRDSNEMSLDGRIVETVRICDHSNPDRSALGQCLPAAFDA